MSAPMVERAAVGSDRVTVARNLFDSSLSDIGKIVGTCGDRGAVTHPVDVLPVKGVDVPCGDWMAVGFATLDMVNKRSVAAIKQSKNTSKLRGVGEIFRLRRASQACSPDDFGSNDLRFLFASCLISIHCEVTIN